MLLNAAMTAVKGKKRGRKSYWPQAEGFVSIGVRIPRSVHTILSNRAKTNFRSMNAELIRILAKEFEMNIPQPE